MKHGGASSTESGRHLEVDIRAGERGQLDFPHVRLERLGQQVRGYTFARDVVERLSRLRRWSQDNERRCKIHRGARDDPRPLHDHRMCDVISHVDPL